MKKKCPCCKKMTTKYSKSKDKFQTYCISCQQLKVKTINSTIYRIYKGQLRSNDVDYTLDELKLFLIEKTNFSTLYQNYKKNNFNKKLCPNVTKIDIRFSYNLNNIQVLLIDELKIKRAFDNFVTHSNFRIVKSATGYAVRYFVGKKTKLKYFTSYTDAFDFQIENYKITKQKLIDLNIKFVEPLTLSCYEQK